MEAEGDSEPLGGMHGAVDLDLAWCHGDSDSLQQTVDLGAAVVTAWGFRLR
jgi:hypothetical protein